MFPLGVGYFVLFVTAFAVGGSLIWTFVGVAIVLLAMFISLRLGDLEALLVGAVSGVPVRRPPQELEGVASVRQKMWARAIDPTTWTGLVYLIAQFPVGIAAFVTVVTCFTVAGALTGAPLIVLATGEPIHLFGDGDPFIVVDTPPAALRLVPLGLIALVIAVHIVNLFSATHATWAQLMLGSRVRKRPPALGPAPVEPPQPPAPPEAVEIETEGRLPARPMLAAAVETSVHDPPDEARGNLALSDLTQREREVLLLLARGMSNADIAEACFISEGTVKTHVKRILAKLDLHDRTQVVVFAYEHGLVRPGIRANGR
jgi:DNA-binding CsgD family transcriptional regulator